MKKILLESDIGKTSEIHLNSILENINSVVNKLHWIIFELECMGNNRQDFLLVDFEEKINNSLDGVVCSFNDLRELSSKTGQIITMDLIGCENIHLVKRLDIERKNFSQAYVVIQVIDGYLWEISTKDKDIINHLKRIYCNSIID